MCVGRQVQTVPADLVARMLGNRVAVSALVTIEPRRRKFHRPITLTIPLPRAAQSGMINQHSQGIQSTIPTLRLLCSLAGKRKFVTLLNWKVPGPLETRCERFNEFFVMFRHVLTCSV